MDINPNYNKTPLRFGLLLSLAAVSTSGFVFINCVEYYGTDLKWKFYCSLAGFSIFFLLFCFVLAANVIAYRKLK